MDEIEDFEDNYTPKFVKDLQESSKETMMDMIYNAVVNDTHGALKHDSPNIAKIEGLNTILNFFKEREEYEKCHEIKKILDKYANNKS